MPLQDLADVTRSLVRLLDLNVKRLEGLPPSSTTITVTAAAPDTIGDSPSNTLSFHLHHVSEDPHFQNMPGPGTDPPNVAKNPMGLSLFYVLTAHHGAADNDHQNALIEQRLLGHAMKTLHDNPVITERTRAGLGNPPPLIWPEESSHELNHLRDGENHIQTIFRSVPPDETGVFRGTEGQRLTQPSAYYEVRVMFLEPEPASRIAGIVLEVGQFVFQLASPTLDRSRNRIRFTVPGPGGGTQVVDASPARVTLNNDPGPPDEHNRLELIGSNLGAGLSRRLYLYTAAWDSEMEVDADLPANADWAVDFSSNRIRVTMASSLSDGTITENILPGIYAVRVRTIVDEQTVAGQLRQMPVSSNTITFSVSPRISGVDLPDGDDPSLIRINIGDEFSVTDTTLEEDEAIQVIIDGLPYQRVADPPGNPQEFSVRDDGTIGNAIRINPHSELSQSGLHPLRVIVNGADSAPHWIEVP